MSEVLLNVLYPQEYAFLEKVRENIVRGLEIEDAVVRILGKEEDKEPKVIYAMKMPEAFPDTLSETRIDAVLERMDGGAVIKVEVFVPEHGDAQKYASLAKGLITALASFRGTDNIFTVSILAYGVKAKEDTMETHSISNAISGWACNDEDYKFWRTISVPYTKWFFEQPDISRMGKNMMTDIKNAVRTVAKEYKNYGRFEVTVDVYEDLMKRAFSEVTEKEGKKNIRERYWLNPDNKMALRSGIKGELRFNFAYETKSGENKPLINVVVSIEAIESCNFDTYKTYQRKLLWVIMPYMVLWQTFSNLASYDCETTIQEANY